MGKLQDKMLRDMSLSGFSENTKRVYLHAGRSFAAHFRQSPAELGAAEIKEYLTVLQERGLSPSSLNVYRTGLVFLFRVTLGRPDVATNLPYHKHRKVKPRILKGSEVARIIGAMRSLKHRAICTAAYAAGLRISEACGLLSADIDSARGRILVRQAKGNKDRYVLLSARLLATLREYWRVYRPPGPYLFPGKAGDKPITTRAIRSVLTRVSDQLGFSPRVTPHHFRHAFATHMLELGTDLRVLQLLLGHARAESTEHYVTVTEGLLGRLTSPLDVLGTDTGRILG